MSAYIPQLPPSMRYAERGGRQIPVRFEGAPGTRFAGDSRWRGVQNFEHAHLCQVFGLDPCSFFFDLPSSVRGIGANQTGHGGGASARRINGFVMQAGCDTPVAKLSICLDGERFKDVDPSNARDFYDLSHA